MSDSPALSTALPVIPSSSALSLTASAIRATLKRSFTDLDLHPAEDSFNPRPYAPARTSSESTSRLRVSHRAGRPTAPPTTSQDVSEEDPDVLIIHPPFVTFPNAHQAADGLTYGVLAANPDWFLDSKDFILLDNLNPNPNAIAYPAFLEPPRGWCPTKKRDAKSTKTGEGWSEGEELKLRCTFCRRGYSGVNAKSMWRRHVFEKHKVAMSNRRDGGAEIRPRGRGATSKCSSSCLSSKTSIVSQRKTANPLLAPKKAALCSLRSRPRVQLSLRLTQKPKPQAGSEEPTRPPSLNINRSLNPRKANLSLSWSQCQRFPPAKCPFRRMRAHPRRLRRREARSTLLPSRRLSRPMTPPRRLRSSIRHPRSRPHGVSRALPFLSYLSSANFRWALSPAHRL